MDYTYLADGSMSTVTDWLAKQTVYTYDDAGQLTKTQYPNTVWTDYGYDAADRLTSVVNKKTGPVTISSFTYTLDAAGNRTGMTGPAGSESYYYDALYRITNPNYPRQSDAYIYDANGNRTLYNEVQYSYDAADQLTCARFWWEQWCPSGGTAYGYDANGNQTSRGGDSFTYNHENRLTSTSIGGVSGAYAYNGDGLRVSRNIGGTNVSYTWDVAAGLPVILQDSQGNSYVYGLDLISATGSGGNQEYYLYDGLGSTTDLTNGSGTVLATYSYDVFGAIRSQSGSSANEFKFTGEQVDSTSLQYLRARYYDPAIGRFLSQDPLPSGNLYVYVQNNPVNFVDPTGLWCPPIGCPPDPRDIVNPLIDLLPEGELFRIPIIDRRVSFRLAGTCALYPKDCAAVAAAAAYASLEADLRYAGRGEGTINTRTGNITEDRGDFYHHCLWSGLATLAVGAKRSESFLSRYEALGGENPLDQRLYDLRSNRLGREFAKDRGADPLAIPQLRSYCQETGQGKE